MNKYFRSNYKPDNVIFANANGRDITIGQDMDFDTCKDFILRQIEALDSLKSASEEMGFEDVRTMLDLLTRNGDDESFYRQIVMKSYHGQEIRDND